MPDASRTLDFPAGPRGTSLAPGPAAPVVAHGPSVPLSAAEVQRFRDEGFLVAPGFCTTGEVLAIRSILMRLFADHTGHSEGNQLDMLSLDSREQAAIQPQLVKPGLYAPALLRTAHFRRVQAMARQLLGADVQFSFDHSILKPAGTIAATPWHQDEAHNQDPHFRYDQVSFWMPLQDVTEDNGCMRYVPGSNHGPVLPHRSPNDNPRIHALECPTENFDESAAVARPIAAGGCILHDGLTLHSALPNRSAADRLAWVLVFRGPPLARREPVRFTWLETKRTSSLERSLRWRNHGGFLVLLARWLRRTLASDCRTLLVKLKKTVRKGGAVLRDKMRGR